VNSLTADQRAQAIVAAHARFVVENASRTVAVDRRCASCGVERESCDRPLCIKLMSENES
jgi:hypothetical protein